MSDASPPFATPPLAAPALADCYFYHTTTIPGHGTVGGEWDLRPGVEAYLGHVPLLGRSVLDIGAATGLLSFYMERSGARVVSYDLSPAQSWDVVPLSGIDAAAHARARTVHIGAINNGYWLCHAAHGSAARMAYGTVYAIDPAIGPVDVSVFGSILLHLRDPFRALHGAAAITGETMVVTELLPGGRALGRLLGMVAGRTMRFKTSLRQERSLGNLVEPAAEADRRISRRTRLRADDRDVPYAAAAWPPHADVHGGGDADQAHCAARGVSETPRRPV